MMNDEINVYRIRFADSDNGYIVVCRANGDLKQLLDKLRDCSGCTLMEIPRDKIQDDKAMGEIYIEQMTGEGCKS